MGGDQQRGVRSRVLSINQVILTFMGVALAYTLRSLLRFSLFSYVLQVFLRLARLRN